jgi:hypothetical protein
MPKETTMKRLNSLSCQAAIAVALLCAGAVWAQEATPTKPAAPGAGATMGQHGMHGCCGRHDTMGWSMMNRQERRDHHNKMMGMKDHASCQAYMQEHHALMTARAKERGVAMPAQPRRDACAGLKK